MGFNGVTWMSKKQPTITFSSTKIEYCVMSKGVKESWLQRLVKDFGVFDYEPIPIFFVNQSSIKLAQNLVFHIRCRNPTLAKCGGEAQHLEKVRIWSPPGLPNV
jgi:hypothetical protein